jgi:hypothetical protein
LPNDPDFLSLIGSDVSFLGTIPALSDEREPHLMIAPIDRQPHPWRFLHSHNFSLPLEDLLSAGAFNEDMRFWGADDLELGYRLFKKGLGFGLSGTAGGCHIFHEASMDDGRYKKNLERFFADHPFPEVELLFIEHLLNPAEAFQAFGHCDGSDLDIPLPDNLAGGFQGKTLVNHVRMEGQPAVPGMGLNLERPSDLFDQYILSHRLCRFGPAVLVRILEEGRKAAKRVVILDPEGQALDCLERIHRSNPTRVFRRLEGLWEYQETSHSVDPVIAFLPTHMIDFTSRNYQIGLLSLALSRTGRAQVINVRAFEECRTNDHYRQIDLDRTYPSRLSHDGPTFVFHPPWAKRDAQVFSHPISVHWDDHWVKDKGYYEHLAGTYDLLLFKTRKDMDRFVTYCGTSKRSRVLDVGLDEELFLPAPDRPTGGVYRTLFLSKYSPEVSGFDLFLRAFIEEFGPKEPIECSLYFSQAHRYRFRSAYFNGPMNERFSEWSNRSVAIFENSVERFLQEAGRPPDHVKIIQKDLSVQEVAEVIRSADLLVNTQRVNIFPLPALEAVFCGIDVIAPQSLEEYDFLGQGLADFVPVRNVSAGLFDFRIQPLEGPSPPSNRYRAFQEVEIDGLRKALRRKFEEWKFGRRAVRDHSAIRTRYSSRTVAGKLLDILREPLS